uniref:Uncharacterized protein n=1 Tax=Lygus hesperus TaxID=30085 RepID=A0A0K8TB57_LYGHE
MGAVQRRSACFRSCRSDNCQRGSNTYLGSGMTEGSFTEVRGITSVHCEEGGERRPVRCFVNTSRQHKKPLGSLSELEKELLHTELSFHFVGKTAKNLLKK